LTSMLARRKQIGAAQHVQVGLGMVAPDFFADFFDANHIGERSLSFGLWTLKAPVRAEQFKAKDQRPKTVYIIAIGDG